MNRLFQYLLVSLATAVFVICLPASAQDYKLEPVRDNVYRFSNGHYHSICMVTNEGIVVTDPINAEIAAWLRQELSHRFSQPIRFVIYSHNHPDHVYGGESFDDGKAQFVAHRLAREDLMRTKARTRIPNIVFNDEMTLYLGDSRVRLRYHGPNNGRGSISMLFEPAGVLHVVDWITLGRLPWKDLQGYDINGMIDSTREVLAMDFAVFVGGHGDIGDKKDVRRYIGYLEALYGEVRDGMLAGMDLPTLQRRIRLEDYSDLKMHREWVSSNVEGVYRMLSDQSYLHMRPEAKRSGPK